jgi:hypothetical protein
MPFSIVCDGGAVAIVSRISTDGSLIPDVFGYYLWLYSLDLNQRAVIDNFSGIGDFFGV